MLAGKNNGTLYRKKGQGIVKDELMAIIDEKGLYKEYMCIALAILYNGNEQCVCRLWRLYITSRTISEGHMMFSTLWSIQTKAYIDCEMLPTILSNSIFWY